MSVLPTNSFEKIALISYYSTNRSHCLLDKQNLHRDLIARIDGTFSNEPAKPQLLTEYRSMVDYFISKSAKTIEKASTRLKSAQNNAGQNNVIDLNNREPVTVAIRMSIRSDSNGAFIKDKYFENEKESTKSIDNLIVLQEIDSIKTCTLLLRAINDVIGPIQNLIISGHGQYDRIRLNPEHAFMVRTENLDERLQDKSSSGYAKAIKDAQDVEDTNDFFETIAELMPEDNSLKRKIVLDSCLTASRVQGKARSQYNFSDSLMQKLHWNNKHDWEKVSFWDFNWLPWNDERKKYNVDVIAGKASLTNLNFVYDKDDKELFVEYAHPLNRLNTHTRFYKRKYATEVTGAIRGIAEHFYFTQDVVELKEDLAFFNSHFINIDNNELSSDERTAKEKIKRVLLNIDRVCSIIQRDRKEGKEGVDDLIILILVMFNELDFNYSSYYNKVFKYNFSA